MRNIKQVSYLNVGENRNNRRIWLENKRLEACGFEKGAQYATILDVSGKKLLIKRDQFGDRRVSGRTRNGCDYPIIDICNAQVTRHLVDVMGAPVKVRAIFKAGVIEISVHEMERKKKERETRLDAHAKAGKVTVGTLCAGGGISCWALHDGLADAGVESTAEFILDLQGQYLQNAIDNNPHINAETRIYEATMEEMEADLMPPVDILNCSLPCTGFSLSGRAKNKLKNPECHDTAATAVFGFLQIIKAVNPAIIVNENVPSFGTSATCDLLRGYLGKLGYTVQERVMGRDVGGTLENRDRHFLVATSVGLGKWDIDAIESCTQAPESLASVLDPVSAGDPMWRTYDYLKTKADRDLAAGKGFKRQLLSGEEPCCGTIGRGYNKARSTEPFIQSPHDPEKSRLLTVAEHCRVKGIPEKAVNGRSATIAHEILGQSVLFGVFKSIGHFLGHLVRKTEDVVNVVAAVPQRSISVIRREVSRPVVQEGGFFKPAAGQVQLSLFA